MDEKFNTIMGGVDSDARKSDGTVERVTIRQLPVKEFPKMAAALDDECALVELYCDKAPGWSDTLTLDSLGSLASAGDKLNTDFFASWFQRRMARNEKLVPGFKEKLMAGALPTTSPKSPPSAA